MVISRLQNSLPENDFLRLIYNKPVAANLFVLNLGNSEIPGDRELLRKFFHATGRSDRATLDLLRMDVTAEVRVS